MNLYAQQKKTQKTSVNKMKRSRDKDQIPTKKDEVKLLFGILLLQSIVQIPKMDDYFYRNKLLATPIFLWNYVRKEILYFSEISSFCRQ
jgi:hypothetical protein